MTLPKWACRPGERIDPACWIRGRNPLRLLGALLLFVALSGLLWPNRTLAGEGASTWAELRRDFVMPPERYGTRPLWFWNAPPNKAETEQIMKGAGASATPGFGILPTEKMKLEFMSPAYLDRYEEAVDEGRRPGA